MTNEDRLRACESNWLNPDYPTYISHEIEEDLPFGSCYFCGEIHRLGDMIEIDGSYICVDCAERILQKWEEMGY